MTGAEIARLLILFGPIALDLIHELTTMWDKQLTPDEVKAYIMSKRKSYDDYIAAEKARRVA